METIKFCKKEENENKERVIIVGVNFLKRDIGITCDEKSLDELSELVSTAGGETVARMLINREIPDPGMFLGEGKAAELKQMTERLDVSLVVFDSELSPIQMKNLDQFLNVRVMDRTGIILDIFAGRAQSAEGKLQVELAQYQYLLPRLSGMRTHLSRQTASGGSSPIGTRGPGETKLETDKRHIHTRIDNLNRELENIKKSRNTQRSKRSKSGIPVVALVGYTNAGKSTLLNALTDAGIHTGNRLFDTLDTTTRRLRFEDGFEVLVSDTVGFISKLPTTLVDAFSATLDELKYASLVLHVADVSDPECQQKMHVTDELAKKLCSEGTPTFYVFTKSDLCENRIPDGENRVSISSVTGVGLSKLKEMIYHVLNARSYRFDEILPYDKASMLSSLYEKATVESAEYLENGIHVIGRADAETTGRLYKLLGKPISTT